MVHPGSSAVSLGGSPACGSARNFALAISQGSGDARAITCVERKKAADSSRRLASRFRLSVKGAC
jgi:hypothetical protein